MPATRFICPDSQQTPISSCLSVCRMGERCLSRRTLRAIAEQREWNGTPSTTQLLKGTREAFLEITREYAINPQDALFRVHGSKAHAFLEQFTDGNELGEERLSDGISSGQFDFYDPEEGVLYDTKTTGSYKVLKAQGYQQIDMPTGEVYKTGEKKGQPKTRKEWVEGGRRDRLDWAIQLNDYRMKLEAILPAGYEVRCMVIEALIRDGGTQMARMRGMEMNGVLININRISDHWIQRYMTAKRDALLRALESGEMPRPCRPRETWSGRKCEKYCNAREHCDHGGVYAAYMNKREAS